MSDELLTNLSDSGVMTVAMNRPDVLNAFDEEQIIRLTNTLDEIGANPAVRVVVLAGTGKHFSAGADINYMQRMGKNTRAENIDDAGRLAQLLKTLNSLPKPTVAKVQGAAFGGGVGLVCCCDIAIGSTKAVFSFSEVKIGLVPGTISPYVIQAIGARHARHLFLTGERIDANEAHRIGLLHSVVSEQLLDEKIAATAATLTANSPNAVRHAKEAVFRVSGCQPDDTTIQQTVELIADMRESHDGREGTAAFLEKRQPQWSS